MNIESLKSFSKTIEKLAEDPSWSQKMIGLMNVSLYKQIPGAHPEFLRKYIGNSLAGIIAGSILGTGAGMATSFLTHNRIPIKKSIGLLSPLGGMIGSFAGGYKGMNDFYKKRGINLNFVVNPKFSDQAIKQYI